MDMQSATNRIAAQGELVSRIRNEVGKVIVGQEKLVDRLILALVANGHILLEGVPGLAKTLSVNTLAKVLGMDFKRISFTPDLLPADVVGTLVYSPKTGEFAPKKGPVFTNLLLADEINRAPAKVQSALLESMQEKQVTLGDDTYPLPDPFLVLATQNPIEQEGTYPLPEAQVDRFMFKCLVETPSRSDERRIMERFAQQAKAPEVQAIATPQDIATLRETLKEVYCDERSATTFSISFSRRANPPRRRCPNLRTRSRWEPRPARRSPSTRPLAQTPFFTAAPTQLRRT
jgi:MoxR-like ATPase